MKHRNKMTADKYMTAREAYTRTVERRKFLEDQGYNVVEMWECDLKKELESNCEMKEFFAGLKHVEPLNPRNGEKILNYILSTEKKSLMC